MRSIIIVIFIIAIHILSIISCSARPKFHNSIVDENLELAIRDTINKPEGEILNSDLSSLVNLNASNRNIHTIEGLQQCTNLVELSLTGNKHICDLEPIAGLTKLEHLTLMDNQINNVKPLGNLTGLKGLGLQANEIDDISPLAKLNNLTSLTLAMNEIRDISPLQNLVNLEFLALSDNQIEDIGPLLDNMGLGPGDEVHFERNPLSSNTVNTLIPQLESRGVIVGY